MAKIDSFSGRYRWLSNFWMVPITFGNYTFPSAEHAYQAAKSSDPKDWLMIANLETPGQAKRAGMKLNLRPEWNSDETKLGVMKEITTAKYQDQNLRSKLIATGDAELIEGNNWKDIFWGVDKESGIGRNHLGIILMNERAKYG